MSEYTINELGTAAIKRVVELEAKNAELEKKLEEAYRKYTEDITHMDKKLQAENVKLRECVEWYADRKNCDNADFCHVEIDELGEEIADGGYRARRVLKELEEK